VVQPRTICTLYVWWNIELLVSLDVAWILCIYVLPKIQICVDVLPQIQICVDVPPNIQICVDVLPKNQICMDVLPTFKYKICVDVLYLKIGDRMPKFDKFETLIQKVSKSCDTFMP
jgi:hypothetical protein